MKIIIKYENRNFELTFDKAITVKDVRENITCYLKSNPSTSSPSQSPKHTSTTTSNKSKEEAQKYIILNDKLRILKDTDYLNPYGEQITLYIISQVTFPIEEDNEKNEEKMDEQIMKVLGSREKLIYNRPSEFLKRKNFYEAQGNLKDNRQYAINLLSNMQGYNFNISNEEISDSPGLPVVNPNNYEDYNANNNDGFIYNNSISQNTNINNYLSGQVGSDEDDDDEDDICKDGANDDSDEFNECPNPKFLQIFLDLGINKEEAIDGLVRTNNDIKKTFELIVKKRQNK